MSFEQVLKGSRLVTVEVLYQIPDFPALVQEFVWQTHDMIPEYPRLQQFLDYWDRHIEGKRLSTRVYTVGLIHPSEWTHVGGLYRLN